MFVRKLNRAEVYAVALLIVCACDASDEPSRALPDASLGLDASLADAAKPKPSTDPPPVTSNTGSTASSSAAVKCGSTMCTAPAGGMIMNVACCLPNGACGAKPDLSSFGGFPGGGGSTSSGTNDGCLDVSPGKPDTSCPSQSLMGFALEGCCSKAGVCGVDLTGGGLGCNPVSGLGALASFAGGAATATDAGPPQACGGTVRSVDAGSGGIDASAPAPDASSPKSADAAPAHP